MPKTKPTASSSPASHSNPLALPPSKPTELEIVNVPLDKIVKPKASDNCRDDRLDDADGIQELATSIGFSGLINPVTLSLSNFGFYRIVAGHRRIRAVVLLKWSTIPATIISSELAPSVHAAENLQRLDLNVTEQALVIEDLMYHAELNVRQKFGITSEDVQPEAHVQNQIMQQAFELVSSRVGKSAHWVRDRHFLGRLDKKTSDLVIEGRLPMEHARELIKIPNDDVRAQLAEDASISSTSFGMYRNREQPMPLSELRCRVGRLMRSLKGVPWKLDVPFANAMACTNCPSNTANQTGLFENDRYSINRFKTASAPAVGVCTNAACFGRKSGLANRQIITGAKRVTVTVSAAKKDEQEKLVPKAIKQHTPSVVKPEVFRKHVKEHRERYASAAANRPNSSSGSSSQPAKRAETAETAAKRKYESALSNWMRALSTVINKKLVSGRLETFHLLHAVSLIEFKPTETKKLMELLDAATDLTRTDALALIAKHLIPNGESIYWEHLSEDQHIKLLEFISLRVNVEPKKPRPKLEDYMPKPKADEPAKKPAGTKKGEKAGGE